jgi:hypothetical protein
VVDTDLALDDVERGNDFDVADVVPAEVDVHEAGDELVGLGVLVIGQALHERVRAVADADDRDAYLVVLVPRGAVSGSVASAHCVNFPSRR